jgi:hypothetical protein
VDLLWGWLLDDIAAPRKIQTSLENTMKSHLKVKVVSLTSEMTYIRKQEIRWKKKARIARQRLKVLSDPEVNGLNNERLKYAVLNFVTLTRHRYVLKEDARITHLAYGFLRGAPYSAMEVICYGVLAGYGSTEPNWKAIEGTVERFSKDEIDPQGTMQRFAEWLADAKVWYEGNKERIPAMWEENKNRVWPPKPVYVHISSQK